MSEDVGRADGAILRREAIKLIVASGAATVVACSDSSAAPSAGAERSASTRPAVRSVELLGMPWQTSDPFLFCVHHDDRYPAGNERLGPQASLEGRKLGY